ncbi:hypothetical protein H1P_800029 [Hyella patelloides LEGE 07179]|uniref:Leucine rich repeat variant n=1 Tax=Hyella patelloides LEGE 07179 TaxID=945734 RepID=A0A563W4C9_9CYAN|nr:hypothetical protein [Hyella patelloides]VEP18538.1 hypothetical protein H1P_800029 [Hyella patelloides LEGE 07179]
MSSHDFRLAVAGNGDTPWNILDQLSKDKNELVRADVAYHKNTPLSTLRQLFGDKSERVITSLASNKKISNNSSLVSQLLQNKSESIRLRLARSSQTSETILEELSLDRSESVLAAVAANTNISMNSFIILDRCQSSIVKRILAENPVIAVLPSKHAF